MEDAAPGAPIFDNALTSFEHFAGLERVCRGIKDPEAAKRRVRFRGRTNTLLTWRAKATRATRRSRSSMG